MSLVFVVSPSVPQGPRQGCESPRQRKTPGHEHQGSYRHDSMLLLNHAIIQDLHDQLSSRDSQGLTDPRTEKKVVDILLE